MTITLIVFLVPALSTLPVEASSGRGQQPHTRAFELSGHDPIGKPGDGSPWAQLSRCLAAYKDSSVPLKELFSYHQTLEDMRIRYQKSTLVFIKSMPQSGDLKAEVRASHDVSQPKTSKIVEPASTLTKHWGLAAS